MKNQFFYTRREPIQGKEGEFNFFRCSFNTDMIIRTEELENGNVLVLLNDIHQRPQYVDIKNKAGKITSTKREMQTFQSEIYLTEQYDIDRFIELMNVDDNWVAPKKEYMKVLESDKTEIVTSTE